MNIVMKITDFLQAFAINDEAKSIIAPHVAKTSLSMNHLYSDLGMKNRKEMALYMEKYFPELSNKKPKNKFWKKFIYDSIGEVAPSCAYCKDKVYCFSCEI